MILIDWLKRQVNNLQNKARNKIVASPSRAFADFGQHFVDSWRVETQKEMLKNFHRLPRVPCYFWTEPYLQYEDTIKPSDLWEWWNS